MHPHHSQALRSSPLVCPPDRVRYLSLVAAARVATVGPASERQIADIVRVTVDDEVDTRTFRAIVADVSSTVRR
jgi:hypothetical protein